VSRRWRNWCQNEVYEEGKEADSRDKVKHNGRSDQFVRRGWCNLRNGTKADWTVRPYGSVIGG